MIIKVVLTMIIWVPPGVTYFTGIEVFAVVAFCACVSRHAGRARRQ